MRKLFQFACFLFVVFATIMWDDDERNSKNKSATPQAPIETEDTYWITPEDSAYMCSTNKTKAGYHTAVMTLPSGLVIHYKYEKERLSSGHVVYAKSPIKQTKIIDRR